MYFRHRGRYDKKVQKTKTRQTTQKNEGFFAAFLTCAFVSPQPVILKELKQMDGDFSETQRIELNTVRLLTVGPFLNIQANGLS